MTEPYVSKYAGQIRTYTRAEFVVEFLEEVSSGWAEFPPGTSHEVIERAAQMYADHMWEFLISQVAQTIDQAPYTYDEVMDELRADGLISDEEEPS